MPDPAASPAIAASGATRALLLRAIGVLGLLVLEFTALVGAYRGQSLADPVWSETNALLMRGAFLVLNVATVVVVALVLVNWARWRVMVDDWTRSADTHAWQKWVFINLAAFVLVLLGAVALNIELAEASSPPWIGFTLWSVAAATLAPLAALAFAPLHYWRRLVSTQWTAIAVAIAVAATAWLFMLAAERLWDVLADGTLLVSAQVLSLFEPHVTFDFATNMLGVGSFGVLIGAPCSGFEGIGLVTTFLSLFLWAFRTELKFPNALLIIPIGMFASWCLNAVRIIVLVVIGAHVSPSFALGGFHDHAGWLMFLIASITLMLASYKIRFFRKDDVKSFAPAGDTGIRITCAYLLPFTSILFANILVETFSQQTWPLYPLVMTAALIAIIPFRDVYAKILTPPNLMSVLAGLAVGIGWIVTDPRRAHDNPLGNWLVGLPAWAAIGWLLVRAIGSSTLVPLAEELAFRGYLPRAMMGRQFETVPVGRFTWLSFIVSTALFAIMHQRWLAAAVAGAVYALVVYRTNRLSDAIAAHATSNIVIALGAIVFQQWSLL